MIRTHRLLALLLLAPGTLPAQVRSAPPQALSVEEAVALARENSPEFLSQRNDQDLARWAARTAYQEFLPSAFASTSLGYQASGTQRFGAEVFGERPAYYSSDYRLGLQYDINGAKLLRPSLARSRARATESQVSSADARLVADVTQQYIAVLEAQEEVAQADRELVRVGAQLRLANARHQAGVGIALDVRRAEVQQGTAEVRRLRAQNAVALQMLTLGQRIGVMMDTTTRLTSSFELFEPTFDAAALTEQALRNNPALLSARATSNAAATDLRIARTAYLPSLSFGVGIGGSVYQAGDVDPLVRQQLGNFQGAFTACQQENDIRRAAGVAVRNCDLVNPENPLLQQDVRSRIEAENRGFPFGYTSQPATASVSVSLPIYTGIGRGLSIQQARVNEEDSRLQVRAQELRLQTEVAASVQNTRTAYQAALLERRVREIAAEELRLAEERFRAGVANSLEVVDAQTRLSEAEQREINAVYNFHRSLALLEALVGQDLRGGARQ
ncbi:TolC family protein [soil metagenome]